MTYERDGKKYQNPECIDVSDIRLHVSRMHSDHQWAVLWEVADGSTSWHRHIDCVTVNLWPSKGQEIRGWEFKCSKSDFRHEFVDSRKHEALYPYLDTYAIVAPASCVDMDIVPKTWGVLALKRDDEGYVTSRWRRKPLSLHEVRPKEYPRDFLCALVRAMRDRSESATKLREATDIAYREGYDKGRAVQRRADEAGERYKTLTEERDRLERLANAAGFFREADWDHFWGAERKATNLEAWADTNPRQFIESMGNLTDRLEACVRSFDQGDDFPSDGGDAGGR